MREAAYLWRHCQTLPDPWGQMGPDGARWGVPMEETNTEAKKEKNRNTFLQLYIIQKKILDSLHSF